MLRAPVFIVILGLPLVLTACVTSTPESARNPAGISLPKLAPPVPEPQDFVKEQRPQGEPEYISVTPPAVQRPVAPRDPDALRKLEAELNAEREVSRAFATRRRPGASYDGSRPPRVDPPPPELMPPAAKPPGT